MGTHYFWDEDEDNVIEEYDDAGETIATYTTEPTLYGNVISQHRDGQTSYFHLDGVGNTVAVTDDNGDVTDRYSYNAFGEVTEHTGDTINPFGYRGAFGYYANPETNDYYVRARTYEPTIARWLSADPIAFGDGMNLHAYVMNDPVNKSDGSGLQPSSEGNAQIDQCCEGNWKTGRVVVFDVWDKDRESLTAATIRDDFREVNGIYRQCCVRFEMVAMKDIFRKAAESVLGDVFLDTLQPSNGKVKPPEESDFFLPVNREVAELVKLSRTLFKDETGIARIFYVKRVRGSQPLTRGVARPPLQYGPEFAGVFIDRTVTGTAEGLRAHTTAHELFHYFSHDPYHRRNDRENLMFQGTIGKKLDEFQCEQIRSWL